MNKPDEDKDELEWTVMFYFAGTNPLSPFIVSQLKAIKDAGFQENTDVVVYFDPDERGVPTRIYDVNRERKIRRKEKVESNPELSKNIIGDGEDPFVHNMEEDELKPEKIGARPRPALRAMVEALENPDDIDVSEALTLFLNFCREQHRAKHYILFLIGHGEVVANDAFLPDENPVSAISLKKLGDILGSFANGVKKDRDKFELLALHSCSMSAIEVAYQLKGTANYMMASEGTAFVNTMPYRQLLKKLFKTVERAKEKDPENPNVDVQELIEKLYFLSFFNAKDFNLSGYPLDLALCNLAPDKFKNLKVAIKELVRRLKGAVKDNRGKELILLAHWEAQSYWEERYTDLFDFCRCLRERCGKKSGLQELSLACGNMMKKLKPIESAKGSEKRRREERFNGLVIRSDSFGASYQYSHGLSVYFPWSRPVENLGYGKTNKGGKRKNGEERKGILERYETEYAFTTDLEREQKGSSWFSFLDRYFTETQRGKTRFQEDHPGGHEDKRETDREGFNQSVPLFGVFPTRTPLIALEKPSPSSGAACTCPSFKNYPEETKRVKIRGRWKRNLMKVSMTKGAIKPPQELEEKD